MLGLSSPPVMAKTLRVLAAVLGYPDAQLRRHLPEMRELLRSERAVSHSARR